MDTTHTPYLPISCEFHDLLEDHATTRKPVPVEFLADDGSRQTLTATIADVYSRERAEYIRMGSGETIRLDRLVAVDGVELADFSADGGFCAT